ncbi:MAG: PaaI family thioesterase [Chloroflexota bacterium]
MSIRQPNSRHCFICGVENPFGLKLKFYTADNGEVIVEHIVPDDYQGYPGVVHGGVVAAMLDEAGGRVYMGDPDRPRFLFTARMDIRYRKNVPTGQPLKVVGRPGKNRSRTATASAAIYGPDGELLAEADLLLVDVPAGMTGNADLEALGWKVYDD